MTHRSELQAVAQRGRRFRFPHLEGRCLFVEGGTSRVGFVVPKHGQTAVRRNRLKRLLREWVRLDLLPRLDSDHTQPLDILIRAQQAAYRAPEATLREEFEKIVTSVIRFAGTRS